MKVLFCTFVFAAALILANPTAGFAQSGAAKAWGPFWAKFSKAIKDRDQAAIKSMTSSSDFTDGESLDSVSVSEWLRSVNQSNGWRALNDNVKSGTSSCGGSTCKQTRNGGMTFKYKRNRWLFVGFEGQ